MTLLRSCLARQRFSHTRSLLASRLHSQAGQQPRMAAERPSASHEERTASEPRDATLQPVILNKVIQINDDIRLFRLGILQRGDGARDSAQIEQPDPDGVEFLPGQWLDTFVPGLPKPGGFTITSTPSDAQLHPTEDATKRAINQRPFFELAVQRSRSNPPAVWLWRPKEDILFQRLLVRVGGSFTWPPPRVDSTRIQNLILIAGGLGINPLISILTHLHETSETHRKITLLYSTKAPRTNARTEEVLFVPNLLRLCQHRNQAIEVRISLFVTRGSMSEPSPRDFANIFTRRIQDADVLDALPDRASRKQTACYVCGPPKMTDHFIDLLRRQPGLDRKLVLCEKWW